MKKNKTTTKSLGIKARLQEASPEDKQILLDGLPHEVGFGKPPRATRFAKGQSGNPKGRKKNTPKDFGELLAAALNETVVVTGPTGRRRMTKLELGLKHVSSKFAKGEDKAFRDVTGWAKTFGIGDKDASRPRDPVLSADDIARLARVVGIRDGDGGNHDGNRDGGGDGRGDEGDEGDGSGGVSRGTSAVERSSEADE